MAIDLTGTPYEIPYDAVVCEMCATPIPDFLGELGNLNHYRCRACGFVFFECMDCGITHEDAR